MQNIIKAITNHREDTNKGKVCNTRASTGLHLPVRRIAATLVVALISAFILAGCSTDEIKLYSAILAPQPMTSYEYEGRMALELRFDYFEQEDGDFPYYRIPITFYKSLEETVNGAGIDITAKYKGNLEKTQKLTEINLTPIYFGGRMEDLTASLWSEVDYDDPIILNEYVKLPKLISAGVGWEYFKGRDYFTFTSDDLTELLDVLEFDPNGYFDPDQYKGQIIASEKFSSSINDALIMLAGLMDTKTAYIKSVTGADDGDSIYHVEITDKGLKDLILGIANIDKNEMKETLRLLLKLVIEYAQSLGLEETGDMSLVFDMANRGLTNLDLIFDMYYPQVIKEINKYFGKGSKFKLLGNDGIKLDIRISKDGYITGCDGVIDFIYDNRGLTLAYGGRFTGSVSKTHVKLKFENRFSSINEDVIIELPKITRLNSISFSRIMEKIKEQYAQYAQYAAPYGLDPYFALEGSESDGSDALEQERPDMLGDPPCGGDSGGGDSGGDIFADEPE